MTNFIKNLPNLPQLKYEPNPSFGKVQVPIMLTCDLTRQNPTPEEVTLELTRPLQLDPFCSTLHYGQSIFEGMKAYPVGDNRVGIFRAVDHARRFIRSAKIMCMPDIGEDFFLETVREYVATCKDYIPKEEGHALYLRPLLFATDNVIKVKSSDNFKFVIMAAIVGDYFGGAIGKSKSKVLVSKSFVRSFPGGTGEAKTAANYAQSLSAIQYAMELGYQQVLYLDAATRTKFEELGGMNFFWVKDNTLYTPKLNGQILHGVTRKSVLELAQYLGLKTVETELYLDDLIKGHADGSITEAFATGTAAVVTPLGEIGVEMDDKSIKKLEFPNAPIADKIRSMLVQTQLGQSELSAKWLDIIKI